MKVIAITGGPCAGKTSALGVLRTQLERVHVQAVLVPEAATDLINTGIAPWTCPSMLEFQTRVIALQIKRERAALARAKAASAAVVICDRGICDSHAYLSDEEYACALETNGLDHEQALARYDAVFHLESVAKGDARRYTRENNSARFENASEAAAVDDRVMATWAAHPRFQVIENRESFYEKVDVLCDAIARVIEMQECNIETRNSTRSASETGPILVSACLLGEPCRYDGKALPHPAIIEAAKTHELVPLCPEQLGGLPTPRTPSEIQPDGRVVDARGIDRTLAFETGARKALDIARERGCTRAILKENSPSCGVRHIYDGTFSGTLVPGKGITAALFSEAGIKTLSEHDVGCL